MQSDVLFLELAKLTEGYSGSDLYDLVQGVHLKVVKEFFDSNEINNPVTQLRPIQMDDFLEVIEKRRSSISIETLTQYQEWYNRFRAL